MVIIATASGCSTLPDDETADWPASRLYKEAKLAMDTADYETALQHLESLEARFPFGRYAQQARLDIIYAYYKFEEPESALAAADRFIKLYPRHPNVDYAYYMKGLANFNKGMTSLDYLMNLDESQRDPRDAREAFRNFAELIERFPESDYANDASQRLVYLHNSLANYEIYVADFYFRRGAYIAVVNRARYVIENYQKTPASREALALMVKAYNKLGLYDLATDALRVLEQNNPDYPDLEKLKTL
jgi:outer membrane protein assembly factor BamD